jgi:hypothetical protein
VRAIAVFASWELPNSISVIARWYWNISVASGVWMVATVPRSRRSYSDICTRDDAVRVIERVFSCAQAEPLAQRQLNDLVDAIEALLLRRYSVAFVLALHAAYYTAADQAGISEGMPYLTQEDVEKYFRAVKAQKQDSV